MAESSLALTLADLLAEVGFYLGYGRDPDGWTSEASASISGVVKSGLRQFYFPPPAQGGKAHEWSFLRPIASLNTEANVYVYDLPDDYGGIEGLMTIHAANQTYPPIKITSEFRIREAQSARPEITSWPTMATVRPKRLAGGAGISGQRFEIWFSPTPDQAYEIRYCYRVLPSALSTAAPYPYGGAAHSETILESCLAIAERRFDDTESIHKAAFQQGLAASISMDQDNQPETFGYNSDKSMAPWTMPTIRTNQVTYNSVLY